MAVTDGVAVNVFEFVQVGVIVGEKSGPLSKVIEIASITGETSLSVVDNAALHLSCVPRSAPEKHTAEPRVAGSQVEPPFAER